MEILRVKSEGANISHHESSDGSVELESVTVRSESGRVTPTRKRPVFMLSDIGFCGAPHNSNFPTNTNVASL